jgi:hypothetical protein
MMLIMVFVGFGDLTGCNYLPLLIRSKLPDRVAILLSRTAVWVVALFLFAILRSIAQVTFCLELTRLGRCDGTICVQM